jgi:transcriptional regulator with XRE-family HTH domain
MDNSSMTNGDLQSLGSTLRQAREQRALTFEEVETQTRIRVKFLQALESGDLSLLPSLAHARGFLRNYAQFLHLDANAIIIQFGELTGTAAPAHTTSTAAPEPPVPGDPPVSGQVAPAFEQAPAPPPPQQLTPYPPPTQSRTRSTYVPSDQRVGPSGPAGVQTPAPRPRYPTPVYGVAVPASAPDVAQPDRPRSPAGRLMRSNVVTGVILGVGMVAIVVWFITQLSAVKTSDLVPTAQANLPGLTASDTSPGPSPSFAPTLTATPEFGGPSIPLDRVLLNVVVTRRTWAQIVVDGKTEINGQVQGGQVLQYQANTSIVLIVGDAEAFDVTYNGQHLGPLGGPGQVAQRIFTPSGQITPTPTMTITPTETLVPSPTERVTSTPTRKP